MKIVIIQMAVGAASFAVFVALGRLMTRRWLRALMKPQCRHRWSILIEKYPTFTQDRWKCEECGKAANFPHDQPPIKTETEVCNMGHIHTQVKTHERDEWPNVVG